MFFGERWKKSFVSLLFHSPREQAKSRQHLTVANNQLDGPYLAILNCLSNWKAPGPDLIEDATMLVEDAAEGEEEAEVEDVAEGLVEAARERDNEGQQPLPPCQLIVFDQQLCICFEEQLNEWVRNYKVDQWLLIEQQQQQQYEAAPILREQQQQQHLPANDAVDHMDNDGDVEQNNNLILMKMIQCESLHGMLC